LTFLRKWVHWRYAALVLLIPLTLYPQIPGASLQTLQDPPGIRWKQIETPHFQIVFPCEISASAQHIASALEQIYRADWRTLGQAPPRIPLLLHNRNVTSNGFVSIAPHRSEWFNTPPQYGLVGATPWYDMLAVHEFRHVVQYNKLNRGFNRILYYLFGEIGWGAGAGFSVPLWFWEGDAVVMETALTRSGRGRQAQFSLPIRALLLSGKYHSNQKMTLGSYRDWVADPYSYGYHINAYVRRHYGPGIWASVLDGTSQYSFIPNRFSRQLHRFTGQDANGIHRAAMAELEQLWRSKTPAAPAAAPRRLDGPRSRFLTHDLHPQAVHDGSVVVYRVGLADQAAFVRLDGHGGEQILCFVNEIDGAPHSLAGDQLVWAEKGYHPRWGYREYSDVKIYNLASGKKRTLTKNDRLFAPALSPDGHTVAAVRFTEENSCALILLDAETGAEKRRLPNPENDFLMTPRWSPDGGTLVYTRRDHAGLALTLFSLSADSAFDLIAPGTDNLSFPVFVDRFVLFNSDQRGIDAIYAIDIDTRRIWQAISTRFGASNPAPGSDGDSILLNDYDLDGYHAAVTANDRNSWVPLEQVPDQGIHYYQPLLAQEEGSEVLAGITEKSWPVANYSLWRNLFKFHSWSPEGDLSTAAYGVSLSSLNLLGTMQSNCSLLYNSNEGNGRAAAGFSYGGFHALVDWNGSYGVRTSTYEDSQKKLRRYSWHEQSFDLGLRLPLNWSRGGYSTEMTLSAWTGITHIGEISDPARFVEKENGAGWLRRAGYDLEFRRYRGAYADIFPQWGQIVTAGFRHTPFRGDYHGQMATVQAILFMPGLLPRQGIRLAAAMEQQVDKNYRFESELVFPRGYDYVYSDRISRCSIDYALPLFYPDRGVTTMFYVRRIRANLFYDQGFIEREDVLRSAGLELIADLHLWTIPIPISLGVRYAHRFEDGGTRFGLIAGLAP